MCERESKEREILGGGEFCFEREIERERKRERERERDKHMQAP